MRKVVGVAVLALLAVACVPKKYAAPPKPVAPTARPFEAGPTVALVDAVQDGPMYRVQIQADITRDVMPTDDLAIVVSVDDHEVGRYPIVGRFEHRPTRIKQEIELPLGDYEIDYQYQGVKFAGMPFRLAQVPVWGGHIGLQLRAHPGTRVSLREKKLWVGRWWPNDGPPQAWIVEWVRDGQVVTMTSGREDKGIPPRATGLVGGAFATFRDDKVVPNTIWTYGEEYPMPDVVAQTPGAWAARVVHGSAAPVAVVFTVQAGGNLLELSNRNIISAGWQPSWSKRLDARALAMTEVDRLNQKMPHLSSTQPFDDADPRQAPPEPAIRVSTAAVRALFRSKELADAWHDYLELNTNTLYAQPAALAKGVKKTETPGAKQEAAKRTKLRQLRSQIEQLIKTNGGPWKPEEHPHS